MTAKQWKNKIAASLKVIKVDPKQYRAVIETLADILEQRDSCLARYVEDGAKPVVNIRTKAEQQTS